MRNHRRENRVLKPLVNGDHGLENEVQVRRPVRRSCGLRRHGRRQRSQRRKCRQDHLLRVPHAPTPAAPRHLWSQEGKVQRRQPQEPRLLRVVLQEYRKEVEQPQRGHMQQQKTHRGRRRQWRRRRRRRKNPRVLRLPVHGARRKRLPFACKSACHDGH